MREFTQFAMEIAQEVGEFLREAQQDVAQIEIAEKRSNDLVTQFDKAADSKLTSMIAKKFPQHNILAEESGAQEHNSDYCWIIDPIDGTTNFAHGIPMFAISIALEYKQELVSAVVYNPMCSEMYTAEHGAGAYLNSNKLSVSKADSLSSALVATGFPCKDPHHVTPYLQTFDQVIRGAQGIRRAGAASLDLAYLAAGRLDGFWEFSLQPWDIAAGVLLIREAGGVVNDFYGAANFAPQGMVAGTPGVAADLTAITKLVAKDCFV